MKDNPISVAIDYYNTLKPDEKKHIPVECVEAVRDIRDLARADPFILSFAIDKAEEVLQEIRDSGVATITGDPVILNQKIGAPYERSFVDNDNRGPGITSGGKDFYCAGHGCRVLFEDREDISDAAEAQGIRVYRIRTDRDHHNSSKNAFGSFPAAVRAFLKDVERDRSRFRATGPFFQRSRVPPRRDKGKGKGKGKDRR